MQVADIWKRVAGTQTVTSANAPLARQTHEVPLSERRSDRRPPLSKIFAQSVRFDHSVSSTLLLSRSAALLSGSAPSSGIASSGTALMFETSEPTTSALSFSRFRASTATFHFWSAWTSLVRKSSEQSLVNRNSSMCVKVSLSHKEPPCTESWKVRTTALDPRATLAYQPPRKFRSSNAKFSAVLALGVKALPE